jgi:hypothetical protein
MLVRAMERELIEECRSLAVVRIGSDRSKWPTPVPLSSRINSVALENGEKARLGSSDVGGFIGTGAISWNSPFFFFFSSDRESAGLVSRLASGATIVASYASIAYLS